MRSPVSTGVTLMALVALLIAPMSAQQQPATFKAGVTLVGVDVTVLDRDGRPVTGLTPDDFQITLNGKPRPVRTLSYVEVAAPEAVGTLDALADAGGRVVASNAVPAEDAKIFVLAIDDLSFSADAGRRTLAEARRFVEAQPPNVLVGLTTTTGAVAVNPTRNREVVMSALSRVVGAFIDPRRPPSSEAPSIGIYEAIEIAGFNNTSVQTQAVRRECLDGGRGVVGGETDVINAVGLYNTKCATDVASQARLIANLVMGTTSQQVSALSNVLEAMQGAPGLKQMVVLTQGVAGTRNLISLFEPVVTAAARAGVQMSILMEDDDDLDMSTQDRGITGLNQRVGGSSIADRKREDRKMFAAALQTLADTAGGTFERVITNPAGAFARAALAGSAVYRLGVEASPEMARSSKPIEVSASVSREGVTLHANRHALVPGAEPEESSADKVAAAIRTGRPFYAVPVRVGVTRRQAPKGGGAVPQVELEVGVDVPESVAGPLTVTIGVLDAHGALKQGRQSVPIPTPGQSYRLVVPMAVAEGAYRVRLAVEDANGGVGSVDTEVDAHVNAMGPVSTSDVLTWWKDKDGRRQYLTLPEAPTGLSSLTAGIELYRAAGGTMPSELGVRLSIMVAGESAPVAEVNLTPKTDGDRWHAEATLPFANLADGTYVLRATVTAAGQRLGDVSTTVVKRSRP